MNTAILETKLFVPPPRGKWIRRKRLIERLNEGLDRKLTLISASAGFGKTALIGEWVAGCGRSVAWLSLDEGDNDLARFLPHLVAAVRKGIGDRGETFSHTLHSLPSSPAETTLTLLLNEASALAHPLLLVLDDYHVIHTKPVNDALNFLLEHLPPQMHLAIVTREDPQLPLGRLRARGQLTELRAADLRFTPGEAADFLHQVMGFVLSDDEVAALEARTEGWIAGLQLAALSMQGREDIPAFIRAFAGDNRYIVDYLVEEVLQRQPDDMRSFLLKTAVLDRLHGPLCDAVTEQKDSAARLQYLERGNFFVVALDDKRLWYRYHHLFAEVLSAFAKAEMPDEVADLHRRASRWYERQGFPADAIRHALAAEDFARAANLVERVCPTLAKAGQIQSMLQWLRALPEELVRCRPVLGVWYAGALLSVGEAETVERRLRDAERWTEPTAPTSPSGPMEPTGSTDPNGSTDSAESTESTEPTEPTEPTVDEDGRGRDAPVEMVVADEEEFRRLPGSIAMYRAGLALMLGDVPAAVKHARRLHAIAPKDDHLRRGAAAAILGLASWRNGELEEAHRMFADGIATVRLAGNLADAINGYNALAEIRIAQGRLREAMRTYERGLQLAAEYGEPELKGTADLYVGMSELYREQGDLAAAARCLERSEEQGEHTGFPRHRSRLRVAAARLREAQGDWDGALALLVEAERLHVSDFFVDTRPIAALKARVRIAQGKWSEAAAWAREQGLSVDDPLSYSREFEHITLARALLAQARSESAEGPLLEAIGLLERLRQAAEEGGRTGSAIEILVVLALARQLQGDVPAALASLGSALTIAEPEGYFRIFIDEGQRMASLLESAAKRGVAASEVRRLLTAFGKAESATAVKSATTAGKGPIEPLSERERDVLRLLGTDLSGPDIARELTVSLNTLRTHTKNIYDKLEVNNRRAAVRRAEELELL